MIALSNYFSVSSEFNSIDDIHFEQNSLLFYGANSEERSSLSTEFGNNHTHVKLAFVEEIEDETIRIFYKGVDLIFKLRSEKSIKELSENFSEEFIYLNITGLTYSAWAWILRAMMIKRTNNLKVIYLEPAEYKFHNAPLEGQIFDLSEKIRAIAPLPGLARMNYYSNENFVFMPLLGFEGPRLSYIFEDIQPSVHLTFPVIGIPGFRYDYPFYSYQGNKHILEREGIWKNRRYEKANCPVSIFILGKNFLESYSDKTLRIAPIGTKPHALGALLLKLAYPNRVDIIYDHPVHKKGRTKGKSRTICYSMNPFKEVIK